MPPKKVEVFILVGGTAQKQSLSDIKRNWYVVVLVAMDDKGSLNLNLPIKNSEWGFTFALERADFATWRTETPPEEEFRGGFSG